MSPNTALHGRDHRLDGADPIPGIGTGGALEWEDTGVGAVPVPIKWQPNTAPSQSIATGASLQTLTWMSTNGGLYETVTSTSALKFKIAGFYIATLRILAFIPAGKVFEANWDIPGATFANVTAIAISGDFASLTMAQICALSVGDNVGVTVRHTEATGKNFEATVRFALLSTAHTPV